MPAIPLARILPDDFRLVLRILVKLDMTMRVYIFHYHKRGKKIFGFFVFFYCGLNSF